MVQQWTLPGWILSWPRVVVNHPERREAESTCHCMLLREGGSRIQPHHNARRGRGQLDLTASRCRMPREEGSARGATRVEEGRWVERGRRLEFEPHPPSPVPPAHIWALIGVSRANEPLTHRSHLFFFSSCTETYFLILIYILMFNVV